MESPLADHIVLKTSWNLATSWGFSVRPISSSCFGSVWCGEEQVVRLCRKANAISKWCYTPCQTLTSRAKKAWTLLVLSRQSKQLVLMVPPWVLKKTFHNVRRTNNNSMLLNNNTSMYWFPPCDACLSRVIEEATLLYELAEVRLEDTVEFVCLASLHILMVVKVHHFHWCCMLWRLQVTLRATGGGDSFPNCKISSKKHLHLCLLMLQQWIKL